MSCVSLGIQAMDFLSQLMRGDVDSWLSERQWEAADINSRLSKRSNVEFNLELSLRELGAFSWSGSLNRQSLRCTSEHVSLNGQQQLRLMGIFNSFNVSRVGRIIMDFV